MARAGRFRIGAMEALWAQLQFAPPAAAQRMVSRIRSFIASVGPETLHAPADVVRELVKFPVEQVPGDEDAMFVGGALRADLAEIHLRLTRRVPARTGDAMALAEAARSCGVSVRTLRRWREQGLLLHWMRDARSRMHVGVRRADLDSFTRSHREQVARAARFRPTSSSERASIRAAVLSRSASGLSERQAIAQAAKEHGRAAGTVRSLVVPVMERSRAAARREDASRARAARLWRLWRRGVPVGAAARHLGISSRMAEHALLGERATMLASMRDRILRDAHGLDPMLVTDAEWAAASSGLAVAHPPSTAEGWIGMRPPQGSAQLRSGTLAVVMRALLARSASACVPPSPRRARMPAAALDRAETDLRWAARILLTIVIDAMPAISARVRVWRASVAGARPAELPQAIAVLAIGAVVEACTADISSLRSGRTRIDRLASAQMDLALARAGTALGSDGRRTGDAMERAVPWCAIAPLRDARAARLALAGPLEPATTARGMLQLRYGWNGGAPHTIDDIAQAAGRPAWVVAGAIGRALTARVRA